MDQDSPELYSEDTQMFLCSEMETSNLEPVGAINPTKRLEPGDSEHYEYDDHDEHCEPLPKRLRIFHDEKAPVRPASSDRNPLGRRGFLLGAVSEDPPFGYAIRDSKCLPHSTNLPGWPIENQVALTEEVDATPMLEENTTKRICFGAVSERWFLVSHNGV